MPSGYHDHCPALDRKKAEAPTGFTAYRSLPHHPQIEGITTANTSPTQKVWVALYRKIFYVYIRHLISHRESLGTSGDSLGTASTHNSAVAAKHGGLSRGTWTALRHQSAGWHRWNMRLLYGENTTSKARTRRGVPHRGWPIPPPLHSRAMAGSRNAKCAAAQGQN